eukprot:1492438-Rhodomonas_salina.3
MLPGTDAHDRGGVPRASRAPGPPARHVGRPPPGRRQPLQDGAGQAATWRSAGAGVRCARCSPSPPPPPTSR